MYQLKIIIGKYSFSDMDEEKEKKGEHWHFT